METAVLTGSDPTSDELAALPAVLNEFAAVVGVQAALRIAKAVGGTHVYIPNKVSDDHWLARAIGREPANKLCAHLGGGALEVPIGPLGAYASERRRRAAAIRGMIEQGLSASVIARRAGVSERTVVKHRAKLKTHRGKSPPC